MLQSTRYNRGEALSYNQDANYSTRQFVAESLFEATRQFVAESLFETTIAKN